MAVAEPEMTPRSSAPRASARIGAPGGLAVAQAKAAREKRTEAERKAIRTTYRSIFIGLAAGVGLYVVARFVFVAR